MAREALPEVFFIFFPKGRNRTAMTGYRAGQHNLIVTQRLFGAAKGCLYQFAGQQPGQGAGFPARLGHEAVFERAHFLHGRQPETAHR